MTNIKLRFVVTLLLHFILFSGASQATERHVSLSDLNILKTLHTDLTGDGRNEDIIVAQKKSEKEQRPILLIIDDGKILFKSTQTLLPVENDYSPASFDGFEVEVTASSPNIIRIIDIQGETTEVNYPFTAGKQLVLRTIEEGNSSYNFNLQFSYDANIKNLKLSNVFLNINNTSCDQSLNNVYAVKQTALLAMPLQAFNSREAFRELKKIHLAIQTGESQSIKLMQQASSVSFNQALSAYKAKDKQQLQQIMATFIEGGGNTDTCPAERYVAEKYYFPSNPRWSNDLGFLFEQAGYFNEAIELLNKVITEQPNRTVAYLNLADSYWAANDTTQATVMYKKYLAQMRNQGKTDKVPKRVIERVSM